MLSVFQEANDRFYKPLLQFDGESGFAGYFIIFIPAGFQALYVVQQIDRTVLAPRAILDKAHYRDDDGWHFTLTKRLIGLYLRRRDELIWYDRSC